MPTIDLSNRISLAIPADQMERIQAAIQALQEDLLPHLIDLGSEDRRAMAHMGDKSVAFVSRALAYMQTNPALRPGYLDVEEFARDLAAVGTLRGFIQPLQVVMDRLTDSYLVAGSEAYNAALLSYQSVKGGARINLPNAATIAADLASQFPGRARKSPTSGNGGVAPVSPAA